jgi:mRNA turnover protein 4
MQTVNMKTALMQSIRQDWKERGVFMHGKLKVLSLGIGSSPSTEAKPNMHKLAEHIGPDCLLFFTNEGPKEVAKYCEAWGFSDHARSGFECTSTYVLPKGPLPQFTFTQDEMLRKLGVPVRVGVVPAASFVTRPLIPDCRFVCMTASSCWTKTTPSQRRDRS